MLKAKLTYTFWALLYASLIYWLTGLIFNATYENRVLTVGLNIALIIFFVLLEKFEHYMLEKLQRNHKHGQLRKLLISYLNGASFKSAMYVFYTIILIYTALQSADPERFYHLPYEYLNTIYYGILILMATDKFMAQITKDIKIDAQRIKE